MKPLRVFGREACIVGRSLVLADLHLGIEAELRSAGVRVPSQRPRLLQRVEELVQQTKPARLVILGDLRHSIPLPERRERREVGALVEGFESLVQEVVLVKGNHDGGIESLVRGVEVCRAFAEAGVLMLHGHALHPLEGFRHVLLAHSHPVVEFEDGAGRVREKVWVELTPERGEAEEMGLCRGFGLTLLPAFGELTSGVRVNTDGLRGAVLRRFELGSARVYLLDGTCLGRLSDL